MAFYRDGQPLMGAFRHPETGFAMNSYPHHDPHAGLVAASSARPHPYPFVDPTDPTQMYHRQPYSDIAAAPMATMEHGVWQAPQAPRLTAAAARAARQQGMGYAPNGFAHAHGVTPWYAQALGVPQPYQQPRTHQQLEHQLLSQHHLAKVHERQTGASMYQPGFVPTTFTHHARPHHAPVQHHHHHPPQHQHHLRPYLPAQASLQTADHAVQGQYARQPSYQGSWTAAGRHHEELLQDQAAGAWPGWQQTSSAQRGSMPYMPHHDQRYSSHPQAQPTHRHLDDPSLHSSAAWTAHNDARTSLLAHAWDPAWHYSQHPYAEAPHQRPSYRDVDASDRTRYHHANHRSHSSRSHGLAEHHVPMQNSSLDAWQHVHNGDQRVVEAVDRNEPSQWQPPEPQLEVQAVATPSAAADDLERPPVEEAANQSQVPAPPSPNTLEKSALPIAAIGAQLIWNACTALFDPDLLVEAHATSDDAMDEDCDEAMSPAATSMPSSSSTPSLNTPDTSPWSSTVLDRHAAEAASSHDWNAFRSPFGPDFLPQLRSQAHPFTLGSEQASSQHDLHRMAVGAERARSTFPRDAALPAKRSRQGSDQSETAFAHSSGGSTASSSEPGTPASLAHGSPAHSSTVSAHSVETARSPLHAGLGMSLDRSRSESAIRARRNSSKTSPRPASSKWSGRIRDNVLAVLRLVSPDWRWSNNDQLFVSLRDSLAPASATAAATAKSRNSPGHGRAGRDSVASIVTSYANEPSPAFRRFVHQVLVQTLLSPPAFLLGILNALRLLTMAQLPDGSIDPVVLELFAQPTSAAPFKLFTLGMMIANKHLDDNTFLNKTWNEVTGIPLPELNSTEAWFLKRCNYEITVPDETWIGFLNRLQSWEEKRSSRGMHRDHESSKRLLLVLDEALGHFDAIPALQLDTASDPVPKAASPMWAKSHPRAGSHALLDDDQQHCRSAPAVATFVAHNPHTHDDKSHPVPHRPSHISRASLSVENPSATLLRSHSDYVASGGLFKDLGPLSESDKPQNGTMSGPLMPSALLNGSRALFHHGGMFGPLATSGWANN